MIRIIVVEDHELVRNLLCKLLNGQPDMAVIASVADGEGALRLLDDGI